jgi:copper oxidase (laccase) domain-containing protein
MTKNIPDVRKQLKMNPFRPFWLETIGGNRIRVVRSDWFHEVPEADGLIYIYDEEGTTITRWSDLGETIQVDDPGSNATETI